MSIFAMVTTIISLLTAFTAVAGPILVAKINANSPLKIRELDLQAKEFETVYGEKSNAFQEFTSAFESFREYENDNTASNLSRAVAKACLLAPPAAKDKMMQIVQTVNNTHRITPQVDSLYQECMTLLSEALNIHKQ